MKSLISLVVALCPLIGLSGNTYSTKVELGEPPTRVEPGRRAPNKPDPLAPLVLPKKDFWVGTITLRRTRDIKHNREGKANINHAFMKGDGHFTQHDELHESYTATITIEPCPDGSNCWARTSGTVEYSLHSKQEMRRTQPRVCRGGGKSVISDADSSKRDSSAKGPAETFASIYWRDDGWYVQASAFSKDVKGQTVIVESSMLDLGCGAKPESTNPKPKTEICLPGDHEDSFSTGNTDHSALRLDETKSIEHVARPDSDGTQIRDHSVIYHLRRIQVY